MVILADYMFQQREQTIRGKKTKQKSVIKIHSIVRGFLGRKRVLSLRQYEIMKLVLGKSVLFIQRIVRGHHGRIRAQNQRRKLSSIIIQRIFWYLQPQSIAVLFPERYL